MTAEYEPSPWEPIAEHVEQYLSSNGEEGYIWEGAPVIILGTIGAKSGKLRRTPLIRVQVDDSYVVIGSMGGAPTHPQWVHNLMANPEVTIHDRADAHQLVARLAEGEEKARLWAAANEVWSDYDNYQASTDRTIPLFICEPS